MIQKEWMEFIGNIIQVMHVSRKEKVTLLTKTVIHETRAAEKRGFERGKKTGYAAAMKESVVDRKFSTYPLRNMN